LTPCRSDLPPPVGLPSGTGFLRCCRCVTTCMISEVSFSSCVSGLFFGSGIVNSLRLFLVPCVFPDNRAPHSLFVGDFAYSIAPTKHKTYLFPISGISSPPISVDSSNLLFLFHFCFFDPVRSIGSSLSWLPHSLIHSKTGVSSEPGAFPSLANLPG